ncbi:MAG TPA: hypothetical protein VGK75_04990, partial [Casimicrobiaceae bacterium]
ADIPGGLTLGASFSDPAIVAVPDGGSATKDTGYVAASALPDLTIAKAHVGNFTQGQTGATFTLTIGNAGPGDTSGTVTVVDTLPTGLTATDISGTGWTCTLGTLTCTRSDALGAGSSYPAITLTVNVAMNAAASVSNSATVGGGGEINTANDSATDAVTIDPAAVNADLGITKSNGSSTVNSGASTTYTIVVNNAGAQAADGAVVTDPVAAGLAQTSVSCGSATGGAVCPGSPTLAQLQAGLTIPTLPSGGSVTFTVFANVTAASGSVSNTASVAAPAGVTDPNGANNQVTDTDSVVVVASSADLAVTKTNGASTVKSGTATTYSIVVSNAGPQAADGAVVTDAAVAGLAKISVGCGNATGGAQCPSNPTVAQLQAGLAIPALPAGGSVTFTVVTSVTATQGSVSNSASVTPPAGVSDPNGGNNSAADIDAVGAGVAPGTPHLIPTLSAWSLMCLIIAMGFLAMRSRRQAR